MRTLIVFSHLRWNFVFQRPQHFLTRLSKFYKILFIEEPMKTQAAPFIDETVVAPNIRVLVPHTNAEGWGFNDAQLQAMAPLVKGWVKNNADLSEGYGLWFYTPQALPMREVFGPDFVVFDVMDELSLFAGAPPQLKLRERQLLELADVVVAGGPSLWASKSQVRPDTLCLPSSVDAAHYSPARAAEIEAAEHIDDKLEHDIPHPRIGFFGVIDERLDIELVEKLANADPHWHIVMVGPVVKIDPASLPKKSNIHWLGQQDYAILPMIVQGWDVCILPFALNDATKFISPTKTLEYMAAEKPIVSTAIHDVVELFGSVVEIGNDHEQFIEHVRALLAEGPEAKQERIQAGLDVVARSSWDQTAETIHQAIEQAIQRKQ